MDCHSAMVNNFNLKFGHTDSLETKFNPASSDRGTRFSERGSMRGSLQFSIGSIELNPEPRPDSSIRVLKELSFSRLYDYDSGDDEGGLVGIPEGKLPARRPR